MPAANDEPGQGDGPNGFTKGLRKLIMFSCYIAFFSSIVLGNFLDLMAKPLDPYINMLLLAGAFGFTKPIQDVLSKFWRK